jgi:hypothetical protein
MASFTTDDDRLSIRIELDDEPQELLLSDGLGDQILDLAIEEMLTCVQRQIAPDGTRWADLKVSTTARKEGLTKHVIGYQTGAMTDPSNWTGGSRQVEDGWAEWKYQGPDYAATFHNGNPAKGQAARPIVGWTDRAEAQARELIRDRVSQLRIDE